jgi:hypothetical protein
MKHETLSEILLKEYPDQNFEKRFIPYNKVISKNRYIKKKPSKEGFLE